MFTRRDAWELLTEFTKSESLIRHALAVESAMRWYARHFGLSPDEVEKWCITGLLHDFDYERHPLGEAPNGHPFAGNRILAERGWPEDIREAILGHATFTGVPRTTLMAKTLFAVDELAGFVMAAVWVRPDRSIHGLEVSSVRKRLKDKAFAKGCDRAEIALGAEELGLPLDEHIANVIAALRENAETLGLRGQ